MPSQIITSTENNFTKGLITEATGLNFPENACIDSNNCIFTLVGDVTNREGIDFEEGYYLTTIPYQGSAFNSYQWNNAGGDGETKVVVVCANQSLYFWEASAATTGSTLSHQFLSSIILLQSFAVDATAFRGDVEATFTDGNGYLFVFHPDCDPFYCTFNNGTISATRINVLIRDFTGVIDGLNVNTRPSSLSVEHQYNIQNQGWTTQNPWSAYSNSFSSVTFPYTGVFTATVASGLAVTVGDYVTIYNTQYFAGTTDPPTAVPANTPLMSGNVTSYSSTTLNINITSSNGNTFGFEPSSSPINIIPNSSGNISEWYSTVGNYPSNADVWWYFKDSSNNFNPSATVANVNLNTGNAPQGHYIIQAFNQDRGLTSGLSGITKVSTPYRFTNGCWSNGRIFYTGVNAQQVATGDAYPYTWTESIYFSQVSINDPTVFGDCYQINDPTSETLNGELPTDGGIINIQGSGQIFKLFPIQNGIIVFAGNGVWFITGSQGIGFSADDYTVTKISSVRSISTTSYVDVNGLPYFWNEEGIYAVEVQQGGGLSVIPLTLNTVLSFYNEIPYQSKLYARAAYDPINYIIQWVYKTVNETSVTDRYCYDGVVCYNTFNKAFYPYTVDNTSNAIKGIVYVSTSGGTNACLSAIKYVVANATQVSFGDEHDTTYVDWSSQAAVDYTATFTTGYKLHGSGLKKSQIEYIYTYSRATVPTSFYLQTVYDYAISGNSGRWSNQTQVNNFNPNYGYIVRRHRVRGRGLAIQLKITSVPGMPFDLVGWAVYENVNQGV